MKSSLITSLLVSIFLLGCGSSQSKFPGQVGEPPPPPASGESRAGITYDITLASDLDGEAIAFTVHEPDVMADGAVYPLILHSHGYAGSRQSTRPTGGLLGSLLASGFGLLSLDERGNGESGGTVRILDPAFEGQDWLQVLDWTEEQLVWLEYEPADPDNFKPDTGFGRGNPRMGAVGGSYGGGFQHLVYAIDNKHRLDALAPDITWNDLRYSLYNNDVFKALWGILLAGLGSAPPNTQDQEVQEGLTQGVGSNSLDEDKQALLYKNSFASHCAGENTFTTDGGLRPIDVFYSQSHLDTLFNFNDAYYNFDCARNLGGDVRLMTKSAGHGLDNGDGGQRCGDMQRDAATLDWYQEKLQDQVGEASYIPGICYNLGNAGTDAIVVDDVAVGGTLSPEIEITNFTIGEAQQSVANIPAEALYTVPAGGDVIAGIPQITINISSLLAVPGAPTSPADPIVFVGLGIRRNGADPSRPMQTQVTPIRGYGDFTVDLVGVFERLQEGDEVVAMVYPSHNAQGAAIQNGEAPDTGDVGLYPTNGTVPAGVVDLTMTIDLPMIGTGQLAPNVP